MRTSYKLIPALFAVALAATPAMAQQAKSGKYTGTFAYHAATVQSYDLEEKGLF
jgi:hypothetical protein